MADVIEGSFANFKLIQSRSLMQIIIEVPIEQAESVINLLGVPQFGTEQRVAIALLKTEAKVDTPRKDAYQDLDDGPQAVVRAAILCCEEPFRIWLCGSDHAIEKDAATLLRTECGISSRSELATNPTALAAFVELENRYRDHQRYGPVPEE